MISVRPRSRDVVFTASAAVARAPRLSVPLRRVIACTECGGPLEVEVEVDLGSAVGADLLYALQVYDSGADCQATVRSGLTILTTNRHLGPLAPPSRQCRGGVYVGPSPQGVFGAVWSVVTSLVSESGRFAAERRTLLATHSENRAALAATVGVPRFLSPKELVSTRPPEALRPLDVLAGAYVRAQAGPTEADGTTYLVHPSVVETVFGGPWAPERFLAAMGGDGGLRPPVFDLPAGLVLRDRAGNDTLTAPVSLGAVAEAEAPRLVKRRAKTTRRVVARKAK